MLTAEQRYRNDPVFKQLVDFIYHGICEHKFTPTEVREAAMLAAVKYEMTHARPLIFDAADIDPEILGQLLRGSPRAHGEKEGGGRG